MKKLSSLALLLLILSCMSLVACGGGEKQDSTPTSKAAAASKATKAPKATSSARATTAPKATAAAKASTAPKEEDKTTSTEEQPASAGFTWDDMPIYPGAEEDEDALTVEASSEESVRLEWHHYKTTDNFDDVVAFYESAMPEKNWVEARWLDLEPTKAGWSMERGIYAKNDWTDQASVEITDRAEGVVYIALMRSSEQEGASPSGESSSESTSSGGGEFTWDDMPIYPGSDTDESTWITISQEEELQSETRSYTTDDSLDKVVEFFKTEMANNGWNQIMWTAAGPIANGMFGKNDDHDIAQVTISDEGDEGIQIQLMRVREE